VLTHRDGLSESPNRHAEVVDCIGVRSLDGAIHAKRQLPQLPLGMDEGNAAGIRAVHRGAARLGHYDNNVTAISPETAT
jgi:hypothetical protein